MSSGARCTRTFGRSPISEKKLHLQEYLTKSNPALLSEMARRLEIDPHTFARQLAQIQPLEIYLPVEAHRREWTGASSLIVVPAAFRDGEIARLSGEMTAYTIGGEARSISSAKPPSTPVLVLAELETDFARAVSGISEDVAKIEECNPGDPCDGEPPIPPCYSNNPNPTMIAICDVRLAAGYTWEHWTRGNPEYAMYVQAYDPAQQKYIITAACINEDLPPGAGQWDMNAHIYTNRAPLMSVQALADARSFGGNREPLVFMWEDDNGSKCNFNPEGSHPFLNSQVGDNIRAGLFIGPAVAQAAPPVALAFWSVSAFLSWAATSSDDQVGTVVLPYSANGGSPKKDIMGTTEFGDRIKVGEIEFVAY